MEDNKKSGWDKVDIILKPVGGLLTAIAVALLGFFGSQFLERRQAIETNARLYTELMSKREEAESALRKDMFKSIIDSFLKPESALIEEKVLNLELLVYNFHESLNLKPLFLHLKKILSELPTSSDDEKKDKNEYIERLERLAKEVVRKQMSVLEVSGKKFSRTIVFERLGKSTIGVKLPGGILKLDNIERNFSIVASKVDLEAKEVKVRLEIRTLNDSEEKASTVVAEFWVGLFDFPMIDNTRLSHDQRCAVILTNYSEYSANIVLLVFPGSHASLKEKPYYEEVIQNLGKQIRFLDARSSKQP